MFSVPTKAFCWAQLLSTNDSQLTPYMSVKHAWIHKPWIHTEAYTRWICMAFGIHGQNCKNRCCFVCYVAFQVKTFYSSFSSFSALSIFLGIVYSGAFPHPTLSTSLSPPLILPSKWDIISPFTDSLLPSSPLALPPIQLTWGSEPGSRRTCLFINVSNASHRAREWRREREPGMDGRASSRHIL